MPSPPTIIATPVSPTISTITPASGGPPAKFFSHNIENNHQLKDRGMICRQVFPLSFTYSLIFKLIYIPRAAVPLVNVNIPKAGAKYSAPSKLINVGGAAEIQKPKKYFFISSSL